MEEVLQKNGGNEAWKERDGRVDEAKSLYDRKYEAGLTVGPGQGVSVAQPPSTAG